MNTYSLKTLLSGVLITPLSDEITKQLESICLSYIEDIGDFNIDGCIKSFMFQTINEDLNKFCNSHYEDSETEDEDDDTEEASSFLQNIIPIVNITMSGYCCYRICEGDDYRAAAICSLGIMNSAKYYYFDKTKMLFPDMIKDMYNKFEVYKQEKVNNIDLSAELSLIIPDIFEDPFDLETIEDTEELSRQLKTMAYYASLYKIEKEIKDNTINAKSVKPYVDVYLAFTEIFKLTPWIFLNNNAKAQISKVTSLITTIKRKEVKDILSDINSEPNYEVLKPISYSSIILRGLIDRDCILKTPISSQKMSVKEFAFALYHELLLEKLLNS